MSDHSSGLWKLLLWPIGGFVLGALTGACVTAAIFVA